MNGAEAKMPGTRYDKFFIEEFSKKLKTNEAVEELLASVLKLSGETLIQDFEKLVGIQSDEVQ